MTQASLFLMTDPRHFQVSYQINPWMRPESWRSDPVERLAAAVRASDELRLALRSVGAALETVGAVEGLPDLVFPANAAIVLDGRALLARFRHKERRGEEAVFQNAFAALVARGILNEVVTLPDGVLQEGAGDCIWDADRAFFWAGYGQRSTENSLAVIAQEFGENVVGLELASERFYHLDTCFCPLEGGKVLYYPPAFTRRALDVLRANIRPEDRIEAEDHEASAFCVNAVNVGRNIIMAKAPASLRNKLAAAGFILREVDLAPFILSGGGAYCMTLRLDRSRQRGETSRAA